MSCRRRLRRFASGQQTIARLATDRLAEIAYSAFIDDDNTEVACVWNDTGCKPPPIEIALAIQSVASQTMPDIKTAEQARQSIYWPLIKRAMEDEIHGKYVVNRAWDVVRQAGAVDARHWSQVGLYLCLQ